MRDVARRRPRFACCVPSSWTIAFCSRLPPSLYPSRHLFSSRSYAVENQRREIEKDKNKPMRQRCKTIERSCLRPNLCRRFTCRQFNAEVFLKPFELEIIPEFFASRS